MKTTYKAEYAELAREYFYRASLGLDLTQMILARKAINKIDVLAKLKKLELPALVLVGREFGETFIHIKKAANALPQADFVILPQAMDPSNLVNPAAFNEHVLRFLETRSSALG